VGGDEGEGGPNLLCPPPPAPSPIEGGGYDEGNFKYFWLEIIGEAAGRVSSTTTAKFPDLPWKKMVNMRNIMIYE
jgi:hypothetical protein